MPVAAGSAAEKGDQQQPAGGAPLHQRMLNHVESAETAGPQVYLPASVESRNNPPAQVSRKHPAASHAQIAWADIFSTTAT